MSPSLALLARAYRAALRRALEAGKSIPADLQELIDNLREEIDRLAAIQRSPERAVQLVSAPKEGAVMFKLPTPSSVDPESPELLAVRRARGEAYRKNVRAQEDFEKASWRSAPDGYCLDLLEGLAEAEARFFAADVAAVDAGLYSWIDVTDPLLFADDPRAAACAEREIPGQVAIVRSEGAPNTDDCRSSTKLPNGWRVIRVTGLYHLREWVLPDLRTIVVNIGEVDSHAERLWELKASLAAETSGGKPGRPRATAANSRRRRPSHCRAA